MILEAQHSMPDDAVEPCPSVSTSACIVKRPPPTVCAGAAAGSLWPRLTSARVGPLLQPQSAECSKAWDGRVPSLARNPGWRADRPMGAASVNIAQDG